jgi:hypothetical protein
MDFFKGLMQVKENFLSRDFFLVGNITDDLFLKKHVCATCCDMDLCPSNIYQYTTPHS